MGQRSHDPGPAVGGPGHRLAQHHPPHIPHPHGLVRADGASPRRYAAALGREDWTSQQRQELVDRLYAGSAGELVAAFVREGALTGEELETLRQLLDDMEV